MTWIDKELRKREKREAREARDLARNTAAPTIDPAAAAAAEAASIQALWERIEALNQALPEPLQLQRETPIDDQFAADRSMFRVLLSAKNGAAVGYTGDAIRYLWPKKNVRTSYNFWIRWRPVQGYRVCRRTRPSVLRGEVEERAFNESSLDRLFRCLVTERRVTFRAVRKRRFWLF
jgi:hypothetical protein